MGVDRFDRVVLEVPPELMHGGFSLLDLVREPVERPQGVVGHGQHFQELERDPLLGFQVVLGDLDGRVELDLERLFVMELVQGQAQAEKTGQDVCASRAAEEIILLGGGIPPRARTLSPQIPIHAVEARLGRAAPARRGRGRQHPAGRDGRRAGHRRAERRHALAGQARGQGRPTARPPH